MKKHDRVFHVAIRQPSGRIEECAIYGETFFAARARVAAEDGVEPGDIRLDPPRMYEGGR